MSLYDLINKIEWKCRELYYREWTENEIITIAVIACVVLLIVCIGASLEKRKQKEEKLGNSNRRADQNKVN